MINFFIEIVYHEQCTLCGFRLICADAILVLLMFILFSYVFPSRLSFAMNKDFHK